MNETANEQLSALMDGELPRDELRFLLRGLDGDTGLAQRWSRYHVARAVLQSQYVPAATGDDRFAAAVMLRLEPALRRVGRRLGRWAGGGAMRQRSAVVALMATAGGKTVRCPRQAGACASRRCCFAAAWRCRRARPAQQPVFAPMRRPAGDVLRHAPASFERSAAITRRIRAAPAQNADATPNGFVPYILMMIAAEARSAGSGG
jgi:sigma-E factor negative regulatory protein RseA